MKYGIVFFFLLSACTDIDAIKSLGSKNEDTNCQKPSVQTHYVGTFEKKKKKILIDTQIIKKNSVLSVLINTKCLFETKKFNLITEKIIFNKKDFSSYSSLLAYSFTVPNDMSLSFLQSIVDNDSCILGIHEEKLFTSQSMPNDPLALNQSYLTSISYKSIYNEIFNSPTKLKDSYLVAVIDIGFFLGHPDLMSQWWVNADEIADNGIDDDNNGVIDDVHGSNQSQSPPTGDPSSISYQTHGTHVAGFIGAATNNSIGMSGIMGPNVKIMAINTYPAVVGGSQQGTFGSVIANSILYAVDNGANVINISMGTVGPHPIIEEALLYAVSKNVSVFVSAGNNSKEISSEFVFSPAFYAKNINGVMAVAATNSSNENTNPSICAFSNYSSSYVEIAAPGCDLDIFTSYGGNGILSAVSADTEPSLYGYIQGTSMASPIAAAAGVYAYAILKEKIKINPTASQVEDAIVNGSVENMLLNEKVVGKKSLQLDSIYKYIKQKYSKETCSN